MAAKGGPGPLGQIIPAEDATKRTIPAGWRTAAEAAGVTRIDAFLPPPDVPAARDLPSPPVAPAPPAAGSEQANLDRPTPQRGPLSRQTTSPQSGADILQDRRHVNFHSEHRRLDLDIARQLSATVSLGAELPDPF